MIASIEINPAPLIIKNKHPIHIQKSVLDAWAILQNPYRSSDRKEKLQNPWPRRMGIFVDMIATEILNKRTKAAGRVRKPIRRSDPATI